MKVALSIRANMNNEIVYVESVKYPLHCRVKKVHLKFWLYVKKYVSDFPDAALSKVINIGLDNNISYLRYYKRLESECSDPILYETALRNTCNQKWKLKFTSEFDNDSDSRLGTYYGIIPSIREICSSTTKYNGSGENIGYSIQNWVTLSVDGIGKIFQHSTYESFMHLW